ncbi:MAG: hypothetical protein KJN76_03635 [Eudoraea sp.]|nr:hypothetical protein [Eudoraea sp.]
MKKLSIMCYYLILVIVVAACTKEELYEPVDMEGIENTNADYQGDIDHREVRDAMEAQGKKNR